ncbi:MAG: tRNA dihydrouridine synthase DusB [Eubacteriales bacterium]|nr:tRNA dihydrouridine synthase DusB [Eubacteriales bacterium]
MFKIGNVEIQNSIVLAPMAGVLDLPYRLICKKFNPSLVFTELISAKGLFYNNKHNNILLQTVDEERPIALQLFGNDPIIMSTMANKYKDNFDIIDINMGCPVPKVVNNHEGSYLMKDTENAKRIIDTLVRVVKKPITVKIRLGFTKKSINALPFAKMCEECGASAITIHARTRDEYYSGNAHWDIIKEVKEALHIPVIGNGDIWDAEKANEMYNYSKVDAIALARGIMGNPWLIRECLEKIEGKQISKRPSKKEIKDTILEHLSLMIKYKGERVALLEIRKHIAWYLKGFTNRKVILSQINSETNYDSIKILIDKIDEV